MKKLKTLSGLGRVCLLGMLETYIATIKVLKFLKTLLGLTYQRRGTVELHFQSLVLYSDPQ